MHGYFNRPDANEDSFTDGWLHSGDIGVMDADGFGELETMLGKRKGMGTWKIP